VTPEFAYDGPEDLRAPVAAALQRVVDPEIAMSILDVGLVYGVTVADGLAVVRMTMTSAACPVGDLIVEEVEHELQQALPDHAVDVQIGWDPPWTPAMMSERGRRAMAW
jgi:metal-sulfur cluster biosynthetic enzyme